VPLIEIVKVSHSYPQTTGRLQVLTDLTVTLNEHRIGVIGANGSGKSTFARLLNGLVLPDSGQVRVDGHDTRRHGSAVRRLVGFCFTDPDAQIVRPTVREDVMFGLRRHGLAAAEISARADRALAEFGLHGHAYHPAHLLSGGQKQLLALASVLVTEPELLVMDEPTTLLDLRNAAAVGEIVAGLPHQVILLTHHLDLLTGFGRVLVFDEGRLVCDDVPERASAFYRKLMG
jgi:biotin transport system ATP-binding protein